MKYYGESEGSTLSKLNTIWQSVEDTGSGVGVIIFEVTSYEEASVEISLFLSSIMHIYSYESPAHSYYLYNPWFSESFIWEALYYEENRFRIFFWETGLGDVPFILDIFLHRFPNHKMEVHINERYLEDAKGIPRLEVINFIGTNFKGNYGNLIKNFNSMNP